MKTEPTEALSWIERRKSLNNHVFTVLSSEAETGCRLAFQEGQSNPKIKQLEWDAPIINKDGSELIESHYIFVQFYVIKNCSNHYFILYMLDGTETTHLSLNEAKAAAQADFEEHVKECLL